MNHVTAVTIGIGAEHVALAKEAATRMQQLARVPVQILDANDLRRSGVSHPCHLKFRLFELVDAENILFFDADAFCLRPWEPTAFCDRREWLAVRGWWFDPWVAKVGDAYGFGEDIFNAGIFLCNRTNHLPVLRLAEALHTDDDRYVGLHNPDEIALNIARAVSRTPIEFLDRRYNWLQFGRGTLAEHADVVIAHACDAELRRQYLLNAGFLKCQAGVAKENIVADELAGKSFIYDRLGYDSRPMFLRTDGTIGRGIGGAERYFMTTGGAEQHRLVIGSELDETCVLKKDIDGVWRGRWSNYERMPVTLTKHRAQVLIDLLRDRGARLGVLAGVELGVFRGESSEILLRQLPELTLFMVDPWRVASAESDYWLTNAGDATMTQSMFDEAMLSAASVTRFAASRRHLVPCRSHEAAAFLPDQLDFVFIDGDHSYSGAASDIAAWWPRLSAHGLMCGHDYGNPNFPGVKRAVDEFAPANGLRVRCDSDMVWYYEPLESRASCEGSVPVRTTEMVSYS